MLVYDQQSTNLIEGALGLQSGQPMGQSFTPSLSTVSFIVLNLYDGDVFQHLGATVFVNLRSDSITGPILSSTVPVFMPSDFFGITNFSFSAPITVTPDSTYYLQPVVEPGGDGFGSYVTDASYTRGAAVYQGVEAPGYNLWFQEGTYSVPEPSSALLVLLGSGVLICVRRRK